MCAGPPPPLLPFSGASLSSSPSRQYQHIFLLLPFFPLMHLSRCEKSSHVIFHLVRYSIDFLSFQIFPSLLWLFDIGGSFLSCAVVCAFAIGTYHHHEQPSLIMILSLIHSPSTEWKHHWRFSMRVSLTFLPSSCVLSLCPRDKGNGHEATWEHLLRVTSSFPSIFFFPFLPVPLPTIIYEQEIEFLTWL